MATAAIYCRVSTEDQARHGYSLRAQEDACRHLAAEVGCAEPIVVRDEGISGAILERPGIERLLGLAASVDYVICKEPDRLARNLGHQLLITERIERAGAKLLFVDFERQSNPEGQLFYALRGAVAEFEKAKIAQRMMTGKLRKAREGGIPTRVYAYGYQQTEQGLEIDPAEAVVVRQIFQWFTQGLDGHAPPVPYGVIARNLNRLGIPTKEGHEWRPGQIWRVLRQTGYMGRWYYRRVNSEGEVGNEYRRPEDRVRRRPRPKDEWIEVPVPAIVDEEIWREAERMRRLITHVRPKPQPTRTYLLTGLAVCGACGSGMVGSSVRRSSGRGRRHYYVCQRRNRGGLCTALPYLRAESLEDAVWAEVRAWAESPDRLRAYLEEAASTEESAETREQLEAALNQVRSEQKRLLRLYQKGLGPEEEIERSLEELRKRELTLAQQLASAADGPPPESAASIERRIMELRPMISGADAAGKRLIIGKMVERVVVMPGDEVSLRIIPRQ